jgi:hypothetical protein
VAEHDIVADSVAAATPSARSRVAATTARAVLTGPVMKKTRTLKSLRPALLATAKGGGGMMSLLNTSAVPPPPSP